MDERELEGLLKSVLKQNLSAGTEAFRDSLLQRCLYELNSSDEIRVLNDNELDMLAAAGNPDLLRNLPQDSDV